MANDWLLADSIVTTAAPSAAGLVRHFKLDGNTDDSSTNAANGVAMGMPTWTTAGKIGGALVVDGVNDWVETSYATDLTAWTISVWAKSPAAPASASPSGPLHREQNYQINWNHTDPVFRGGAGMQVGTTWYGASFGTLRADTWYHLAATYDGDTLRAYKNGVLITANTTPTGNPTTATTTTLKLGRHATSTTSFFTGTIDDARVYNQVLTAAQVAYLADTTPADGQLQVPVNSAADLYSAEPAGSQKVNLKDFAKMAQTWLEELLWPQ
jgi:hypothetical protein